MLNTFEEAVYKRMMETEGIAGKLTKWGDSPAIFNLNAVSDMDENWEGVQYPRVVYYTEWNNDPSIQLSGKLYVQVQSTTDLESAQPKVISEEIKDSLSNVLLSTLRGVFCCSWEKSEPFLIDGESEPVINGMAMDFDVIFFPDQWTYLNPDPVPGIENYLKAIDESIKIINQDELPEIYSPTKPVAYVRSISLSNIGQDTYAYRFMQFNGAIHLICTNYKLLRETIGKIQQQLMIDGEVALVNNEQLLITDTGMDVNVSYTSPSLLEGQFQVTGRFIIEALPKEEGQVNRINIYGGFSNGKDKEDSEQVQYSDYIRDCLD